MIPAATVYFGMHQAFVRTMSDSLGALLGDGPIKVIENFRLDLAGVGLAVREALAGSRKGVPRPENWDDVARPYVELSGAKSWSDFARRSVSITIQTKDGQLEAQLWGSVDRNGGSGGVEGGVCFFSPEEKPEIIGQLLLNLAMQSGRMKSK